MYKGLPKELVDIVEQIKIGDGVVVKHHDDYILDKSIGYVVRKNDVCLRLRNGINPNFFLAKIDQHTSGFEVLYGTIAAISIVNPVE